MVRFGGSLSGEHGDGQSRGPLLGHMFSPEMLDIFREFKSIWDPDGLLNPGKLIDADRVDSHLREGAGFELPQMKSHFHYPEDRGNFAVASARCVGAAEIGRAHV